MSHDRRPAAPDFRATFSELTGLYLLLSPELRILAASRAYLRETHQTERIFGQHIFEAFPDTDDNAREGRKALTASFARVLASKVPDTMALQRYDVRRPDGSVDVRYWNPVNTPILDELGEVALIIHRVADVTEAVRDGAREPRVAELETELFHSGHRLTSAYDDLRDSEARLRLALAVGGAAVWRLRLVDDGLVITPELNRLIGFAHDHPTTVAEVRDGYLSGDPVGRAATEAWQSGRLVFEDEFRYRRHDDGRLVWLHIKGEILRGPDGRATELLGVVQDVTERVSVQERQQTLINELNHRVKNNLALVQSLANRTFRGRGCDDVLAQFIDRLIALGGAHELLTRSEWQSANLSDVVASGLRVLSIPAERLHVAGPEVRLGPDLSVNLSLALHELATNAIKYGSLSTADGEVEITWSFETGSRRLRLLWRERHGPPVAPPRGEGFGSQLLSRIFMSAGGQAVTTFAPQGVCCEIELQVR